MNLDPDSWYQLFWAVAIFALIAGIFTALALLALLIEHFAAEDEPFTQEEPASWINTLRCWGTKFVTALQGAWEWSHRCLSIFTAAFRPSSRRHQRKTARARTLTGTT